MSNSISIHHFPEAISLMDCVWMPGDCAPVRMAVINRPVYEVEARNGISLRDKPRLVSYPNAFGRKYEDYEVGENYLRSICYYLLCLRTSRFLLS